MVSIIGPLTLNSSPAENMSLELLQLLLWLVFVAIGIFLYYSGILHDIHVMVTKPPISGQIDIVYKYGKGPYQNVKTVFKDLVGKVPSNAKFIGIYYDDPEEKPAESHRWAFGAISGIDGKPELQPDTVLTLRCDGFKSEKLPSMESAVVTQFCNTTFLSIILASWRVYRYLKDFLKENKLKAYPIVELYYEKKIIYCMPLARQEDFFLPELQKSA